VGSPGGDLIFFQTEIRLCQEVQHDAQLNKKKLTLVKLCHGILWPYMFPYGREAVSLGRGAI
jgi:hypothetical protein